MTNIQREIAQILLKINAVGFVPDNPIMFKSGIKSPVYVDNRKLPFYPKEWEKVILGFEALTKEKSLQFDIIAGIESAGIPHSAALGFLMKKPSVFVRKKIKEHGTKKLIEGGDVNGKQVLLIEDLVTTGSSSLAGVEALREGGAKVINCLIITSYEFPEAKKAFAEAGVKLHALTSFPIILKEAMSLGLIKEKEEQAIKDFLADPHHWNNDAASRKFIS